ncbi:long-chain-fatty-acid-CoA ligase [Thozetella sp. PMI_491]|nr:long-chain-fatty-acid-CoA ligase [Thozetella sp. PMI_491]
MDDLLKSLSVPPPAGSPYAVPLAGTERENRSAVYRHWRVRDRDLVAAYDPELQTLHALFEASAQKRPGANCLGSRPWDPATKTWGPKYEWLAYSEVARRRKDIGVGIRELHSGIGVADDEKYGVGIWSQNRPEWQITELACLSQSLYAVSLYDTLGPESTEYIINHAELRCIVSSPEHIQVLLDVAPKCASLKIIIALPALGEQADGVSSEALSAAAKSAGIQFYSLQEVEDMGKKSSRAMLPPTPGDIVTINYTSGTTGTPKGVVMMHSSAVAGIAAAHSSDTIHSTDVNISYLPLAHILGRALDQSVLMAGGAVGYFHGNIRELVDDMKILQPTIFVSVPRLYNRFNSVLRTKIDEATGLAGMLSRYIIRTKKAMMKAARGAATNRHWLYDWFWTPKVLGAFGLQRVQFVGSGSAPLDPDVLEFLRAAFGRTLSEGYGLTEAYGLAIFQFANDFSTGNVGAPAVSLEVCLESLPDFDYLVTDKPYPRGELLLRGPAVFSRYHNDEEETRKTIDKDGWFHTGDVAAIDELGRIRIIDRKKNVLKLSQGEYLSPERIENVYLGSCPTLAMAYVHGDSTQSCLVAVFGVDPAAFSQFAGKILKKDINAADTEAVKAAGADPAVKKAFLDSLAEVGKVHGFNGYEHVKNCLLLVEPFTADNGLLTPTLKLKRVQTARAFRKEIDQMYAELA